MQQQKTPEKKHGPVVPPALVPATCILATLGFSCLTVWGIYVVFAPTLPLLSFGSTDTGIACLVVSRLTANIALIICIRKPKAVFGALRKLLFPGAPLLMAPAFVVAALSWLDLLGGPVQLPLQMMAWVLLGAGELGMSLAWTTLLSMMPARWIALSIACGGALATPLFLLVGGAGNELLGIMGIAFVLATCIALAQYLLTKAGDEPLRAMETFRHGPTIPLKTAFSVAANGLVYGYIVIMLAFSGLHAILIAAAAGLAGSLMAIVWAMQRTKSHWDVGTMQRLTVPLVVASLLLIPFGGDMGRIACGAVAVGAFGYATLMEWTDLVTGNAEFQLYPVDRFAKSRLAQWSGFLIGACIAYVAFHMFPLDGTQLMLLSCALVIGLVAIFSFYGADDSEEKELMAIVIAGDDNPPVIDPPKSAAPFRERCAALATRYDLSEREAEVLICLAKGRNAEYIQQKLFISSNTAKTHISHIYKKLGINSQQRLIDLVDLRDGAPDDVGAS